MVKRKGVWAAAQKEGVERGEG
ncbi:hypothetical protein CCACVL1_21540 [Corchorus capsularis]|uniref:Uncharacterized protein n=1 Tax=Corchorus capsularis TaxID=210143 RepID=A0A1R3H536_COCAP|nr:hypothetical protein CCACVL1_21540 [Corchorus capsularis]